MAEISNHNALITYAEVISAAENIVTKSTRISEIFDEFKRQVNVMTASGVYEGLSRNEFEQSANELSSKFNVYVTNVVRFARELHLAHDNYQDLENYLARAAANLPK